MFRRLLIANRGEVAVRVARAARALGISPLGVASRADLGASWLEALDGHVCIGEGAPGASYLRMEAIVQAALQSGCSAVHPGWGFLAENPRFAALCRQHGLTFVGPSAAVMRRMGLKRPAKAAMGAAGLTPIPGSPGLLADADGAAAVAAEVGYPVILKANAGGGGRGMRLCADEAALREAFPAASSEAAAAFGNGALYLERYLEGSRHVEVQLLADRFGTVLHLFERECSIQRHHQKLLEESPSPALTPAGRAALGAAAVRAAAALGYVGAGTIEFLLADGDSSGADGESSAGSAAGSGGGEPYFVEMNARLQVEHPVSELVTGIDVVQTQLRLAANQPLGLTQDEVRIAGHAIECRINAEDPADGFRPTPGRIDVFDFPDGLGPGTVRVDTHLAAGDEVSPHYDSLIAKVIAHGTTREEAIATLVRALGTARVQGVATTIPMHLAVLDSPEFQSAQYDTRAIPGWPQE